MNGNLYGIGCDYLALREQASAGFANISDYSGTAQCTQMGQPAEQGGYKERQLRKAELLESRLKSEGIVNPSKKEDGEKTVLDRVASDPYRTDLKLRDKQTLVGVLNVLQTVMREVEDHADLRRWRGCDD